MFSEIIFVFHFTLLRCSISLMAMLRIVLIFCYFSCNASFFPVEMFFDQNEPNITSQYMCNSMDSQKVCNCDRDCMQSRTCCIDKLWHEVESDDLDIYMQEFVNTSNRFKRLSCEHVIPSLVYGNHKSEKLLMVASCYGGNSSRVKLDYSSDIIPVLGKDGYIYKNKYYAECNSVDYTITSLTARCKTPLRNVSLSENYSIDNLRNIFQSCKYTIHRNFRIAHYFHNCYNNSCSVNNYNYELCNSYMGLYKNFQNYHCYKCNTPLNSSSTQEMSQHVPPENSNDNICIEWNCADNDRKISLIYPWTFRLQPYGPSEWRVVNSKQSFPIVEFFNISQPLESQDYDSLVNYLCATKSYETCCSCSEDCMMSKTCCIDKLWNPEKPLALKAYINMFVEESKKYKNLACRNIIPQNLIIGHKSEKVMVVSSCCDDAPIEDVIRCESSDDDSLELSTPVFGADNYIYRNAYCAKCNFVYKFQAINISTECQDFIGNESLNGSNSRTRSLKDYKGCFLEMERNSFTAPFIKSCIMEVSWSKVCDKRNSMFDLCNAYTAKVFSYANYHCYQCNYKSNTKIPKVSSKCYRVMEYTRKGILPWSFIIKLSGTRESLSRISIQIECKPGEIYNYLQGKCINHTCLENYHLVNNVCELKINLPNPTFDTCLVASTPRLFVYRKKNESEASKAIQLWKSIENVRSHNFSTYVQTKNVTINAEEGKFTGKRLDLFLSTYNQWSSNISDDIEKFLVYFHKNPTVTYLHKMDLSRSYQNGRICAEPIRLEGDLNFTSSCDVYVNKTFIRYANLSYWIEFQKQGVKRQIFTCRKFYSYPQCKSIILLPEKVTIGDNKTLIYRSGKSTKLFLVDHYIPLKDGFGVCTSHLKSDPKWLEKLMEIEGYISLILSCISIICYIAIIITYTFFKDLRKGAGLSAFAMCLCSMFVDSMFTAVSVLYATDTRTPSWMCKLIAIMLHYGLLVVHTWTLLIAADIAFKFHRFNVAPREGKRFHQGCAFAFLSPLVIVCLSFSLHSTNIIYAGYGDHSLCFIQGYYAKLVFYFIPAVLVLLTNFALLIFIVFQINSTKKECRITLGAQNEREVNMTIIAYRLAIIFGLSELFGFIQIPKSNLNAGEQKFNEVFSFLYSIMRSLRGAFLFLSYIFRSKVWQLYKRKFQNENIDNSIQMQSLTTNSKK